MHILSATARRGKPASLVRGYSAMHDTLSHDNGGIPGPDYSAHRHFGGRLMGPFSTSAGIGLPANDPTLWTPLRRLLFPVFVFV